MSICIDSTEGRWEGGKEGKEGFYLSIGLVKRVFFLNCMEDQIDRKE